ncbi:MAG: cobalamin biosynthesis protein [Ruminococcus sp.]|nr:cobalamin biosynthesis protein [Ruminococcus sp.]
MMIMNTLCALALGFFLDSMFGDTSVGTFLPGAIRKYETFLDKKIKGAYADTPEARNAAGGMFEFLSLTSLIVVSILLFYITYSVSNILGILTEGIMCSCALGIRNSKTLCAEIMRAAQKNDVDKARVCFNELTGMDASQLEMDDIIRCTVESSAANITDCAVAPLFWTGLFGGIGGFVYRCVNTADRVGGRLGGYEDRSGRIPTAVNKFFSFVPSRIAAKFCVADGSMLLLDSVNGSQTVKAYAGDSQDRNAAQTQAACAGLLNVSLDSGYPNGVIMTLGKESAKPDAVSIYWVNQLISGTSVMLLLLIAAIRVGLFFLL